VRRFLTSLGYLWRRRRNTDDLDEEMRLHVELRARRLAKSGVPESEALAEARRRFGSTLRLHEQSREARVGHALETVFQDVRYALRLLRLTPLFTTAAVLTLSLGIGANTAIFTLIDAYLLRPLPVRNPSRLVQLRVDSDLGDETAFRVSLPCSRGSHARNALHQRIVHMEPNHLLGRLGRGPGAHPRSGGER
jgi:hypothetical protein